jgi:hypothetical protein
LANRVDVDAVVTAVGCAVTLLTIYASGGAMITFIAALRTVRIERSARAVVLRAWDAQAMMLSGFVLWAVPPLLLLLGYGPAGAGAVASFGLWFGFRTSVEVTAEGTLRVRKFACIVPWRRELIAAKPRAFTDGWGDFADPESLNLEIGGVTIELAWGDATSGSLSDELAAEFIAAVAALFAGR